MERAEEGDDDSERVDTVPGPGAAGRFPRGAGERPAGQTERAELEGPPEP